MNIYMEDIIKAAERLHKARELLLAAQLKAFISLMAKVDMNMAKQLEEKGMPTWVLLGTRSWEKLSIYLKGIMEVHRDTFMDQNSITFHWDSPPSKWFYNKTYPAPPLEYWDLFRTDFKGWKMGDDLRAEKGGSDD